MILGKYRQWAMGKCFYCQRETYRTNQTIMPDWAYTRDHLIPRRLRGKVYAKLPDYLTTVVCCYKCNILKKDMSVQKFINKYLTLEQRKRIPLNRIQSLYRLNE